MGRDVDPMSGRSRPVKLRPTSLLFVCVGNTCRSVLAEHIAKRLFGPTTRIESAGILPQMARDAADAIHALKEFNIDASGHQPRHVREVDPASFELVVALDSSVLPHLGSVDTRSIRLWKIPDPWMGAGPEDYRRCAHQIMRELKSL